VGIADTDGDRIIFRKVGTGTYLPPLDDPSAAADFQVFGATGSSIVLTGVGRRRPRPPRVPSFRAPNTSRCIRTGISGNGNPRSRSEPTIGMTATGAIPPGPSSRQRQSSAVLHGVCPSALQRIETRHEIASVIRRDKSARV
jgi:hypothetical protein